MAGIVSAFRALLEAHGPAPAGDAGAGQEARAAWLAFADLAAAPVYEPFTHGSGGLVHVDQDMDGDLLLFETSLESGVLHAELTAPDDQHDRYNRLPAEGTRRAYHNAIHTKVYFDWSYNHLEDAVLGNFRCDIDAALKVLEGIKGAVEDNHAPFGGLPGAPPPDGQD